jgi:hypothetical protein
MPWAIVGQVSVGAEDREVEIGRVSCSLRGGVLPLLFAYASQLSPDNLSFCIVDFLGDDGVRSLGSARWWPKRQGSLVNLGPGVAESVEGRILVRPRSFNTRWLRVGLPSPVLPVRCSVWVEGPGQVVAARFVPRSFSTASGFFVPSDEGAAPGGARPLVPSND